MASSGADPQPSGSASNNLWPTIGLTRCSTALSFSSDSYASSISGLITLTLHGNCSRCHHHHSSARFKVNLSRNPHITTELACERCHQKWLVVGGRNTTQLSLQSLNSTGPDPAANEVRSTLVEMVRTTIPFTLSPVLAEIAELPSRRQSLHNHLVDEDQIEGLSLPTLMPGAQCGLQKGSLAEPQEQGPESSLAPPTVRPTTTEKYGLMTGRRMSRWKQSLGMHFPAFHRANLQSRFGTFKKSKMSAKQQGKQPMRNPASVENMADTVDVSGLSNSYGNSGQMGRGPSLRYGPDPDRQNVLASAVAAEFLATVRSEPMELCALTEKERYIWVREKYTDFTNRSTRSRIVQALVSGKETTPPSPAIELPQDDGSHTRSRQSMNLFGVGSARSLSARTSSVRASVASFGDQSFDGSTVVDDTSTVASGPRSSWQEQPQHGSLSLNAFTLRRLRQNRAERLSTDSTLSSEATRNIPRPGYSSNQHSGSSTARPSALGSSYPNASQTSIESHDSRDHTIA